MNPAFLLILGVLIGGLIVFTILMLFFRAYRAGLRDGRPQYTHQNDEW